MKSSKSIHDLFPSFLDGTLMPAELGRLFHHFEVADEQELRKLIEEAMRGAQEADQLTDLPEHPHLDAIYDRIDRRLGREVELAAAPRKMLLPRLFKYAASILLVIGVAWTLLTMLDPFGNEVQWSKVTTGYQRKKLVLPDGTGIWLAPQSTFEYPQEFTGGKRSVRLNGEAFFEVIKDTKRPFTIQSGSLTTRVLGTSFNINAYQAERSATVTVLTGKVSVAAESIPSGDLNLLPFQQALFQSDSQKISLREYPDANELLRRREGHIRYAGTGLADIIRDIQKIAPYQIVATGDLANCVFYGEMKAGDDPVAFLENVCRVNNLTLKKQNETLTVTGKGCGR
ncbi:FecR family protein [Dyadobacter aurulentus]|uniref:FecR family protein n=1 Tax=Dyadobacter sp. UC 10 TaxID=2605428 RepID=UPI0011F1B4C8|nr:FecR domain-containing protein [Dyadobacter sp. UC 10]KAA0993445.1 hypothetical protein FXO21_26350 [Dyadobacter sp. UC 10]